MEIDREIDRKKGKKRKQYEANNDKTKPAVRESKIEGREKKVEW